MPYDGSKPSENALREAAKLAAALKDRADIVVLNVVQEMPTPPMMTDMRFKSTQTGDKISFRELSKELCQEMKDAVSKDLEGKKRKIEASASNLAIKTKVLVGYPADKIIEFAEDEKPDVIVMGNTGLGGFSKFKALGSVSRSVAERAKCPVMIVH